MKTVSLLVAIALSFSSSAAFVLQSAPGFRSRTTLMAKLEMTSELEAAIADVRDAASAFGEETAHFANGAFLRD